MKVAVLFFVALVSSCWAQSDLITSLPDYAGPLGTQYSGYINLPGTGKYMHYWFIQSFNNPTTDPLVLWLNGGPGCSSMDGLFYEQGPIHFTPADPDNNTVIYNDWTWSTVANMIFLESPVGVGFSYSTNSNDYKTNDTQTAEDNYAFLKAFFAKYPSFQKNNFWISGESYAGIYVPTLSNLVYKDTTINFKGMLVGNGVTDSQYDTEANAFVPFVYGHGIISEGTYNDFYTYCTNPATLNTTLCNEALTKVEVNMGDIDIYDIYGDCYHQRPSYRESYAQKFLKSRVSSPMSTPPCTDAAKLTTYLNRADVQAAIHVKLVSPAKEWSICSDVLSYHKNTDSVLNIYQNLIAAKKSILVYSGDTDGAVPFTGTIDCMNALKLPVKKSWVQWFIPAWDLSQVAGYATYYEGLTFTTIKGSGHMVPQFKPEAAFYMFSRFISNGSLSP